MSDNRMLVTKDTIEAWADIVLKEWDKKASALGISDTHELISSFVHHVHWHAGGDLQRIEFAFNYYGKFVDMGVGRGVSLDTRDAMIGTGLTTRRPKPWFTDTFYKEVAKLRYLIAERTSENIIFSIVRTLEEGNEK